MKPIIYLLRKAEILSAISIKLTYLTGKSKYQIHPKHLVLDKLWLEKYLKRNDIVLDIGCNSGQTIFRIAPKVKKIIGVEVDKKLLDIALKILNESNLRNIELTQGDANKKLPFKKGQFTKVICSDVLEHLDKRSFALKEIYRVLKKGGNLFLVTDNPNTTWKKWQKNNGFFYYADIDHRYEYSKDEIINVLKKNNFKINFVDTVTYNTPLAPFIDLVGGFSLSLYKKLRKWRENMNKKYPQETTGYRIIAKKS